MALIDLDFSLKVIEEYKLYQCKSKYATESECMAARHGMDLAKMVLHNIPTVEAKPVVHAHWKYYWDCNCDNYSYCCSNCGKDALTKEETMYDQVLTEFCPYCGAQMEEAVE